MKRLLFAIGLTWLWAGLAWTQEPQRLYTHPVIPPQDVLDRLNLNVGWSTVVSTLGKVDGLLSVQVLEDQILAQTHSGGVTAINPRDGSTQWRARFGTPFRARYPLGYNSTTVLAYNGLRLFGLNRRTGAVRWEIATFSAPTAAPVADDERAYLALSAGRLDVYRLPGAPRQVAEAPGAVTGGAVMAPTGPPIPTSDWSFHTDGQLEQPPILIAGYVTVADNQGNFITLSKEGPVTVNAIRANAPIAAPLRSYGDLVYAVTLDGRAYAARVTGGTAWRFAARSAVMQRPAVTDFDVFLGATSAGLYRLDRTSGEEVWRFADGDRFLATNPVFVYVTDRNGRLVVLDRARGTRLSAIEARDFVVPVENDVTDRVYLAAHDGTLVCLHDRNYAAPFPMRKGAETSTTLPKPAEKAPPPEPSKEPSKGAAPPVEK